MPETERHLPDCIAEQIADEILNDVTDRRSWRQAYDNFDEEVQQEIRETWIKKIKAKLDGR